MIRIVSDGTAMTTKVYTEDGSEITGITCIDLLPIVAQGIVAARLTFEVVELDVVADDGAIDCVEESTAIKD